MVGVALKPGTSAVVTITSNAFLRAVQKQVPIDEIRGTVTNLSAEISAALAEKKDLAIGVLLTETGLAVRKIAVNEESAEVVAAVFTDEAVVAGAAYVDARRRRLRGGRSDGRRCGDGSRRHYGRRRGHRRRGGPAGGGRSNRCGARADENKVSAEKPAETPASEAPAA